MLKVPVTQRPCHPVRSSILERDSFQQWLMDVWIASRLVRPLWCWSLDPAQEVWPQLDFFLNWAPELGICLYEVSLFFMYKKTLLPPIVQGSGILNQPHLFQPFIYIK